MNRRERRVRGVPKIPGGGEGIRSGSGGVNMVWTTGMCSLTGISAQAVQMFYNSLSLGDVLSGAVNDSLINTVGAQKYLRGLSDRAVKLAQELFAAAGFREGRDDAVATADARRLYAAAHEKCLEILRDAEGADAARPVAPPTPGG